MDICYKLGQIENNKFIYNIIVEYKKNNKKYKLESNINIDLVNDYPNYKFIKNSDYLYYCVHNKQFNTETNKYINKGDLKRMKYRSNNKIHKEIYKDKMLFTLAEQYEYDKLEYLNNFSTCNAHLYLTIYNYVLQYFKLRYNSKKQIRETIV